MTSEYVTEVMVLPTGATLADLDRYFDLRNYVLKVHWRGNPDGKGRGGYGVSQNGLVWLSRAGKWATYVPPFRQWQYRWATLDEALDAARAAIDSIEQVGMTYAQYREWFDDRTAAG